MIKSISKKKTRFYIISRSFRDEKVTFFYNWLKNGIFYSKFHKNFFFYQHSQTLYDVMQKEIENLEFF